MTTEARHALPRKQGQQCSNGLKHPRLKKQRKKMVAVGASTRKGNHGRAAQKQIVRRLIIVSGILFVCCLVLAGTLIVGGSNDTDPALHPASPLADNRSLRRGDRKKGPRKRKDMGMTDRREVYNDILDAKKHLVDLRFGARGDPEAVQGGFCRLSWRHHKEDPSTYPMFRDLVGVSPDCESNKVYVNLKDVVRAAKERDDVNVLQLGAVVFHESRCGSTLTANLLASWRPDRHRVYSESTPPMQTLNQLCGEGYTNCSVETAADLLRDVVYLMSRSNDPRETHVFFKIQSAGSRNIAVFQHAFPETPYMFVYRDPVQVMMSHLKLGTKNANCLRQKHTPGPSVARILQRFGDWDRPEDFCAAHLASITESVVESLTEYAIPLNYKDMPDILFDEVFPQLTEDEITEEELGRMRETGGVYSKGRGEKQGQEFQGDSEQKDEMASDAVREAAEKYLMHSYQQLEEAAEQRKQQ